MLPIGNSVGSQPHVEFGLPDSTSMRRPSTRTCSNKESLMRTAKLTGITHSAVRHASLLPLVAALTLLGCSKPAPANPVPEVTVAPVLAQSVAESDEFTGHFEAVQSVEVRPRVTGFVQRVAFSEGATVQQGDPLFEIDARPYEAEASRAEAGLEQAKSRYALAQQELDRAKRLVSTQAISREELDARTSGLAEGAAAVRAAEAALRAARLNLEWTVVRAPISGRVGRAQITRGNLVQAGPPNGSL